MAHVLKFYDVDLPWFMMVIFHGYVTMSEEWFTRGYSMAPSKTDRPAGLEVGLLPFRFMSP